MERVNRAMWLPASPLLGLVYAVLVPVIGAASIIVLTLRRLGTLLYHLLSQR